MRGAKDMKTTIILLASLYVSFIGGLSQAALNDLGNGLVNDSVKELTYAKDGNLAKTACEATTGREKSLWDTFTLIHPNIANNSGRSPAEICADNGKMNWHEAQAWANVLNRHLYLGKRDWRQQTAGLPAPSPQLSDASDITAEIAVAISAIIFESSGGEILNCTISPVLPTGLSITLTSNGLACEITGTPTEISAATTYTVTATNATGSDTATVGITIDLALVVSIFTDDTSISNSFTSSSGYPVNYTYNGVNYFGIHPMLAIGNRIYLGLGGLPAHLDGAVIASYEEGDSSLTTYESIHEQGIMDFSLYKNGISIPGADPCCGDIMNENGEPGPYNSQWDWGNFYYLDNSDSSLSKHRNLPNTVHGWGSWYDETNNILYYAGSGHMADTPALADVSSTGLIYSTLDFGQTWIKIADRTNGIGDYRTYDIIGIEGKLYIQLSDELSGVCAIAKSSDQGQSWLRIPNSEVGCSTRLYNIENQLVALASDGLSFRKINASEQVTTHVFSSLFSISAHHTLSHDEYGNVYVGTTDGRVMHTVDFNVWTEIANVNDDSISFNTSVFWEEKEWLMLGNWGDNANLWKVRLINSDNQGLPDVLQHQ